MSLQKGEFCKRGGFAKKRGALQKGEGVAKGEGLCKRSGLKRESLEKRGGLQKRGSFTKGGVLQKGGRKRGGLCKKRRPLQHKTKLLYSDSASSGCCMLEKKGPREGSWGCHPANRSWGGGRGGGWGVFLFLRSPVGSQVAAGVPGGGGGWRTDALVVILHLQADGPPQAPGDVQQPLHDELAFLLRERRAPRYPKYKLRG